MKLFIIIMFALIFAVFLTAARGPLDMRMDMNMGVSGGITIYENLTIDSDPLLIDGSNVRTQQ